MNRIVRISLCFLALIVLFSGCESKTEPKQKVEEQKSPEVLSKMKIEQNFYPDSYLSVEYPYTKHSRNVVLETAADGSKSETSLMAGSGEEVDLGVVFELVDGKPIMVAETYENNLSERKFEWNGNTGTSKGELGRIDEIKLDANGNLFEWGSFDQSGDNRSYYSFLHNTFNAKDQLTSTVRWALSGAFDPVFYCRYDYESFDEQGNWTQRKALILEIEYETGDPDYDAMSIPNDLLAFPANFDEKAKVVVQTRGFQ